MSGGGQSQEQGAGSPDWLVNAVGTLVIALGSVVFRAFARKIKSYRAKDPEIGGNENQ